MKPAVVLFAAAVCVSLGSVATSVAQSPVLSPPPGVAAENWVPTSNNAGVVLSGDSPASRPRSFGGVPFPFAERRAGVLMVNFNGRWISFETLGDNSPRVRLLSE